MIDRLILWGVVALAVSAALVGAYKAWDHYVGEPYREEGRVEVRTKELAPLRAEFESMQAAVKKANDATAERRRLTEETFAAAKLAMDAANARAADARAREIALLKRPPASKDPCVAACQLLSEPLQ